MCIAGLFISIIKLLLYIKECIKRIYIYLKLSYIINIWSPPWEVYRMARVVTCQFNRIMVGHVSIQILSVGGAAVIKAYTEQLPPRGWGRGIGSASKDQNPSQRIKIYHDQGRKLIMLVTDHDDDAPPPPRPRGVASSMIRSKIIFSQLEIL